MSLRAADLFSLKGSTALLTGASGFLGRMMTRTLLENGARVIALGRSERVETEGAQWQREFGSDTICVYRVDMYDLDALTTLLGRIAVEFEVDILINNAHELGPQTGFNVPEGTLENATHEQWVRNLTGGIYWAALTTQRVGAGMKQRGHGSIINIATMYALVAPNPRLYEGTALINPPGYSAAKAGLLALTRYTASFWGAYGIRANAILPGPFTNTQEQGPNSVQEDDPFLERLNTRTLLNRHGLPSELAGAVLFLASNASSFVTGHALVVDGGWTVT